MWAQAISLCLGIWLMAAPDALGYFDPARTQDHILGPIIASVGCMAMWEVARTLRWINLFLGFWLVLSPWILAFEQRALVNSMAVGIFLSALAGIRGQTKYSFSGGWRS